MDHYRITLSAMTNSGRYLVEDWVAEMKAERAEKALSLARREFFAQTGLVSGVQVEPTLLERRREQAERYMPLISAWRAVPGTHIKLEPARDGRPYEWVTVDHWEPQGDGRCRLVTTDRQCPYAGLYERFDAFETTR